MKITPTSAMRARDVSRPRAEHLAAAAEREAEAAARHRDAKPAVATPRSMPRTGPLKAVPSKAVPSKAPPYGKSPLPEVPPPAAPPTGATAAE